tara:strand:- start:9942 stop:10913 length:972 start_codon:yes stop_codon:yes gene_type:complete
MTQPKKSVYLGENRLAWYLDSFTKYVLAILFVIVTGMGDYLLYAIVHEIDRSWFYPPIISIVYLIWNIKRIATYQIYKANLPNGSVLKLVEPEDHSLAYEMFAKVAPVNKTLEIYRCIGLDNEYKAELTRKKAILYIEEETFLKMSTDKKLFHSALLLYLSEFIGDITKLSCEKASCMSFIGNTIDGSRSINAEHNASSRNNHIRNAVMTSTAVGNSGSVAVSGIFAGGKGNERAANAGVILLAIGYLLVILAFGLIMMPLIMYFQYRCACKARSLVMLKYFENNKINCKNYTWNLREMDSPDLEEHTYYTEKNGWSSGLLAN